MKRFNCITCSSSTVECHACNHKGLFTPSDSVTVTVTDIMLTDKIGMQPILAVTVPVKKIKGAAHQCYGDSAGFPPIREIREFRENFKTFSSQGNQGKTGGFQPKSGKKF